MPSRAMTCMIATGRRYLGPFRPSAFFERLSSREVAFRDLQTFHVTLHSSLRIELQIINILLQFFYDQEVKLFTFLSPDVKDI